MAVAFNTNVSALEDELTHLILDGQISARIDSHAKVVEESGGGRRGGRRGGRSTKGGLLSTALWLSLQVMYARQVDQRSAIFQKALEVGEAYQLRTKV